MVVKTVASRELLTSMNNKAVEFLRQKGVPSEVIKHNQEIFYELAASLNGKMLLNERKSGISEILLLALYHENIKSSCQFPDEVKESISNIFEQFCELKKRDISFKTSWEAYAQLATNNLPLLLFRIIDLTHLVYDKEFLLNIGFNEKKYEEQITNLAKTMHYVYAPYADILGLGQSVDILRNISANILYPEIYTQVQERMNREFIELSKIQEEFDHELNIIINEAKILHGIPIVDIEGKKTKSRIKSPGSTVFKLVSRMMSPSEISSLHDIVAFTVLPKDLESVYLFYEFLREKFGRFIIRVDDYISNPKSTGYKSLHIDIAKYRYSVELQLKTPEMYISCEKGDWTHAASKDSKIPLETLKYIAKYSGILKNASTEQIDILAENLSNARFDIKVEVSGKTKTVSLPKNAKIFDLICIASNPEFKNIVINTRTGEKYSYFDDVPFGATLKIVNTGEGGISKQRLRDLIHQCRTQEAHEFLRKQLCAK